MTNHDERSSEPARRPRGTAPDQRLRTSQIVSEGGLEPPRPYRAPGPQPGASANSATPTWPSGTPGRTDILAERPLAPNRPWSLALMLSGGAGGAGRC